ncbi:MAG TPA: hypothetical protein VM282_21800 [Acidimicrobiales bacterium]|nr:hypothetical protein [Acidimicrobiales bacterium]
MTALTVAPTERISAGALGQLAIIEAVRSLRRVSVWAGLVLAVVLLASSTTADWPGGGYIEKLPQSFAPIVLGTFIAAFRTGRRDADYDVAESAAIGCDHRALARLSSLALPVLSTVLVVVGFAIASRIEGGFWLGDHPRRTDTALHPFVELAQPVLIVAFVGAAGIAIGRSNCCSSNWTPGPTSISSPPPGSSSFRTTDHQSANSCIGQPSSDMMSTWSASPHSRPASPCAAAAAGAWHWLVSPSQPRALSHSSSSARCDQRDTRVARADATCHRLDTAHADRRDPSCHRCRLGP